MTSTRPSFVRVMMAAVTLGTLVGLQFGLAEAWVLRQRGFALPFSGWLEIAVGHLLFGLVVALVLAPLFWLIRPRRWSPASVVVLTPAAVFLFMAAVTVNMRWLHGALRPESLLVDVGLIALTVGLAFFAARRLRSLKALRALFIIVLIVDVGVAAFVLRGEDSSSADTTAADPAAVTGGSSNVIIVLLDTLRPDHMGIYGYERETSPRIDQWAQGGTVFDRAYSSSNWTRPAVASLHSSTMPSRHGMNTLDRGLPSSLMLVATELQARGYQTGFFTVGVNIEPEDGYARGVDHFYYARSRAALERTPVYQRVVFRAFPKLHKKLQSKSAISSRPDLINERVFDWADSLDPDRPAFFYIHYMGPHSPYKPEPQWLEKFSDVPVQSRLIRPPDLMAGFDALSPEDLRQMIAQYDGEILMHDAAFNALMEKMRELGRLKDAVVVVTADHGEAWGEHGYWEHGRSLFEEVVRIPLIVRGPEPWEGPPRAEVPASLVDLAPTVLDLVGGEIPPDWDGSSLGPWLRGERTDSERVVFQENPIHQERGLRDAEWAYFEGEVDGVLLQWLFAADDLQQTHEMSERYPLLVEEYHRRVAERSQLDAERGDEAPTLEMDEARRERLKALGYID